MKKLTKLFAGLIIFASTLMMTSCLFDWEQTYDTWYMYRGGELDVPIVQKADAESDASDLLTGNMEDAEFYVCFSPDDGLTVAVQSTTEQTITIGNGVLTTTTDIVTGGSHTYANGAFGTLRWKALYATGLIEESDTPEVIAHPDKCIILASDDGEANKFDFHWKKVLKQILINKLLGED